MDNIIYSAVAVLQGRTADFPWFFKRKYEYQLLNTEPSAQPGVRVSTWGGEVVGVCVKKDPGEVGRPHHQLVGGEGLEVLQVDELRGRVQDGADDVVVGLDRVVHNLELELLLEEVPGQGPVPQDGVGLDDVHLHSQQVFSLCPSLWKQNNKNSMGLEILF